VDPVPDPLLFFSGSAENRTRASGSVAMRYTELIAGGPWHVGLPEQHLPSIGLRVM
jgi:hypothetical protein